MRVTGKAVVSATISIELNDAWGGDCTVEQIHKQAREGLYNRIRVFNGTHKPEIAIVEESIEIRVITYDDLHKENKR